MIWELGCSIRIEERNTITCFFLRLRKTQNNCRTKHLLTHLLKQVNVAISFTPFRYHEKSDNQTDNQSDNDFLQRDQNKCTYIYPPKYIKACILLIK